MGRLGSLPEFKESLRRSLSSRLKSAIVAVTQAVKQKKGAAQDASAFGPQASTKTNLSLSIPPSIARISEDLLSELCKRVQVILYNLFGVLKIVSLRDEHLNTSEVKNGEREHVTYRSCCRCGF